MNTFRIGVNDEEILEEVFLSYGEAYSFALLNLGNPSKYFKIDIEERDEDDETVNVKVVYEGE